MGKVIVGMTMSPNGFINDPSGSVEVLYPALAELRDIEPLKASIQNAGAVVMGRNLFVMSENPDWFAGNYEYQVPIFVLTHHPPEKHPKETNTLQFTFVTDGIDSGVRQAKAAAGDQEVNVSGATNTLQQCLSTELANEQMSASCRYSWVAVCGHLMNWL